MGDADGRRDDERDEAVDGTPDWNTPEEDEDELPVAVRRVLASDQHLSQRRVFYGQAGADEDEDEPADEDAAPQ
jgi:hypothetical protein